MNLLIISIIMYAALHDLRDCKIPNKSVFAIVLVGITQSFMTTFGVGPFQSIPLADACLGLIIGLVVCLFLHRIGIFGAGDAKLLASLGTIVGFPNIILVIAASIITASLLSLFRLACYGELNDLIIRWKDTVIYRTYQPPKTNSVAASGVPMGGAILLATMYCHFYLL